MRCRFGACARVACAVLAGAFVITAAIAQDKVYAPSQITEAAVIEALAGTPASGDPEIQTRGFRVAAPAGAVTSARKLPMLLTFQTDSADLLPQTKAVLDRVAAGLRSERLAGQSFIVEGHADPRGTDEHNLRLSRTRAENVLSYLIKEHGLTPERFSAVGKGSSELMNREQPIAAENRRVSLVARP